MTPERVRIDKWLWAARFFKTRTLAAESIAAGHVSVNEERAKAAKALRIGDLVVIRKAPFEHAVVVKGLSEQRGSATIAATAAIVAEFVGANKGLGYVLLRGTSTMDIELVFAVLVVLTVVGIAINYLVEFFEWAMTPWQRAKYN